VLDDGALPKSADLFDNELTDGESAFPEGIEFLLHPCYAVVGVVFPNQFVILGPRAFGVVGAADEGSCLVVLVAHDARLAVDETEFAIGNDANIERPSARGIASNQILKDAQAFLGLVAIDIHQMREATFIPNHAEQCLFQFLAAPAGRLPDGVDISGVHLGIADDADLLDGLELLRGEAKQT